MTRILFLGAGAVGGYFGGRLAETGADVTFLVRERRAAQLANGLQIESPMGDATLPVKTIRAGDPSDPFDIIVLTCKAYGLPGALDSIAPHVGDGAVILPLLNGLAHVAKIEARFPSATVWGGVAQIPASLSADGIVQHHGKLAGLIVGPRAGQGETEPLAQAFVDAAKDAGISARFTQNPAQDMWDKWVFLATLAASTCLCRGDVGEILATTDGRTLLSGLLDECLAVASAQDHPPADAKMANYREMLNDPASRWTASMRHDLENGGATEADHIIGEMIALAEQHAIETPLLRLAMTVMQVHENRLRTAQA